MIASFHVADIGFPSVLGTLRRTPTPESVPGLRYAKTVLVAPFSGKLLAIPNLKRVGLIAFWDGDEYLDKFLSDHPTAQRFAGGWHVRLEPVRITGTWPGFPEDGPLAVADPDSPVMTFTLGQLRVLHTIRFRQSSAKAEARLFTSPGVIWASGLARLPLVVSCSLWENTEALVKYAYGPDRPGHVNVLEANKEKPFHHHWASIRFSPYRSVGELGGKNGLPATALAGVRG